MLSPTTRRTSSAGRRRSRLSRQKKVDFTSMTFVTGGGLLSLAGSGIDGVAKLAGKSVAVVSDTTSETALKEYLAKNLIDAKVVVVANRDEAMKQLSAKQVDAFAGDQIVQIGFLMQAPDPGVLPARAGSLLLRALRVRREAQRR